jgi:hypothetical protein
VFSKAGSGSQRREIRVERLLLLVLWLVVILIEGLGAFFLIDNGVVQCFFKSWLFVVRTL